MSITKFFMLFLLVLGGCSAFDTPTEFHSSLFPSAAVAPIPSKMMIFIFGDDIVGRAKSVQGMVAHLREIKAAVGESNKFAEVGLAVAYPYTAFLEGQVGNFVAPPLMRARFLNIFKALQQEKMPLILGMNGSVWASGGGPYNAYWKTAGHGKYLMKYEDGRFNAAVKDTGKVNASALAKYSQLTPYSDKLNTLYLTNSQLPSEFVLSRRQALDVTLKMFKDLDTLVPGVLTHLTTDSEVCNFSFRKNGTKIVQLGYEEYQVQDFCKNRAKPCPVISKEWRDYRAGQHRSFVQVTVDEMRRYFPTQTIYTHQYPVSNSAILTGGGIDMGTPLSTAVVNNAYPGYTVYAFGGKTQAEMPLLNEISAQTPNSPWGAPEFNPARNYGGSKSAKAKLTKDFLKAVYKLNCRLVSFLSWKSNSLDTGIKGSGVDDGIKQFISEGPQ